MSDLIKRRYILLLRYGIGAGVIISLVYYVQKQEKIIPILGQYEMTRILPALALIILHLVVLYYLWRNIILNVGVINPGEKKMIHSFFGGRTLGLLTPGHSGELLKGLFFSSEVRMEATSLSILYAGYGIIVRSVLGVVGGIYFVFREPSVITISFNFGITIVLALLVIGLTYFLLRGTRIITFIIRLMPDGFMELFALFNNQIRTNTPRQLLVCFVYALVANILSVFTFMVLLSGFGTNVFNFEGLMAFEAAYFVMSILPFTPSSIGVRETSRVYFFSLIGCSQAEVLCASFIMFFLNIILPAVIGIWSLNHFMNKDS